MSVDGRIGIDLSAGVWFNEELREMTVFADQYDFAISLLLLGNDPMPLLSSAPPNACRELRRWRPTAWLAISDSNFGVQSENSSL